MPLDSLATQGFASTPPPRRALLGDAASLLLRAAASERRHVLIGVAWLVVAALLEATGPLAGKYLIDNYLLPRNAQIPAIAALLIGALLAGMAAGWLRYLQLSRLAGLARRSVRRIRERV
ncbi:MAG: ATP-binding cassette protein [Ramlibacter sp.]|nr:ATP-binding cassette protein [Ramlibacter sp.]